MSLFLVLKPNMHQSYNQPIQTDVPSKTEPVLLVEHSGKPNNSKVNKLRTKREELIRERSKMVFNYPVYGEFTESSKKKQDFRYSITSH
jgi:hypothetical protein